MRALRPFFAVLFALSTSFASEIREFSVPTLERLGNELYRRDTLAKHAADVVLQTQPVARSLKLHGWITDLRKAGDMVYMITDTPSGPSLAYAVTFHSSAKPEVQDRRGQPLPPNVALRFKARETGGKAMKQRLFQIDYNLEVLDDPDGSGFLVYALGETGKTGEVVIAGHLRATVSADGEKAQRVDRLSESLMIENKNKNHSPVGYHDVAVYFNQIISDKPVETFIYVGKLLEKDIFVGTPDHKMWVIHNGKMILDNSKPNNKTAAGAARAAFRQ